MLPLNKSNKWNSKPYSSQPQKCSYGAGLVYYPRPQRVRSPRENSNSTSRGSSSTSRGSSSPSSSVSERFDTAHWDSPRSQRDSLYFNDLEPLELKRSMSAPSEIQNSKARNEVMRIMHQTDVLVSYRNVKVLADETDIKEDRGESDKEEEDSFFENFRCESVGPPSRPSHPLIENTNIDFELANLAADFPDCDESYDEEEEEFILDPLPPFRCWSVGP